MLTHLCAGLEPTAQQEKWSWPGSRCGEYFTPFLELKLTWQDSPSWTNFILPYSINAQTAAQSVSLCVYIYICDSTGLCYMNFPLRRSMANPWAKILFAFARNILHSLSHIQDAFSPFFFFSLLPLSSLLSPQKHSSPSSANCLSFASRLSRQGQAWWILALLRWGLSHRTCPIAGCPNS